MRGTSTGGEEREEDDEGEKKAEAAAVGEDKEKAEDGNISNVCFLEL